MSGMKNKKKYKKNRSTYDKLEKYGVGRGIEVMVGTASGAALCMRSGQDGDSVHDRTRTGNGNLEV